jgi:hypothetical protein
MRISRNSPGVYSYRPHIMRGCIAPRQWTVNKKWVIEENERKREASTGLRDRANGIIDDSEPYGIRCRHDQRLRTLFRDCCKGAIEILGAGHFNGLKLQTQGRMRKRKQQPISASISARDLSNSKSSSAESPLPEILACGQIGTPLFRAEKF